jgi:hypothetical protein
MKIIKADFRFNPIGQGAFYTGKIDTYLNKCNEFNFVFDCGTLSDRSNLITAISNFKRNLNNNLLNVLFISHLDDDHVNGINELLNGITCNDVYMPYLSPFERLIVSVRHKSKDTNNLNNFINFIKSPHDYILNDNNVGKLTYIKGNSENEISTEKIPEEISDNENVDNEFTDFLEPLTQNEFNGEIQTLDQNSKIVFKKANRKLKIGDIWEFYLYNELASEDQINQFIESVNFIYGITINKQLTQADLITILNDSDKLKFLRDQFRKIFKNLNKTGLIVQHKPLSYKRAIIYKENKLLHREIPHYFNIFIRRYRYYNQTNRNITNNWGVTLLTGDIGLNQIENSTYIKKNLRNVKVFQVPHHGSKTGWDNKFLKKLNNKGLTTSVINFGYGNTYGHPKPNVVEDLVNDNHDIRFCNQFEDFEYEIILKF